MPIGAKYGNGGGSAGGDDFMKVLEGLVTNVPVVGGLLSSVFGTLIGSAQEAAEKERIRKIQQQLEESKIGETERAFILDRVSDTFDNATIDALNNNSIGLATSGITNPEVAQGVVVGEMLGKKKEAELEKENYITQFNSNVDLKIAEVGGQYTPQNPILNFVAGGLQGIQTGLTIEDIYDSRKYRSEMLDILRNLS